MLLVVTDIRLKVDLFLLRLSPSDHPGNPSNGDAGLSVDFLQELASSVRTLGAP